MPRWTAAQMLSGFAREKPKKLEEWRWDMDGKILPAQLQLREAIIQGWIIDVRGRRGPPGSKERMPDDLFSDPEFTLLVAPHGALTVHPPHRRQKFEAKYGVDLDNWWREIDFDRDEGERALAVSLAPCQRQPNRPHLHLVSGARSGETEAPAARAEESMPEPASPVEPEPAPPTEPLHVKSVPVSSIPEVESKALLPTTPPDESTLDQVESDAPNSSARRPRPSDTKVEDFVGAYIENAKASGETPTQRGLWQAARKKLPGATRARLYGELEKQTQPLSPGRPRKDRE
jgi:hypothetical protein